MDTVTNANSQVYYNGHYWNDLPRVLEYMCENFTGDKNKWWVQDFKDRFAHESFKRGLFLNCGNGWVERDFVDKGIVQHAIAFDYSLDLLQKAQDEKRDRPISYFRADANRVDFAENQFDLIVNVAALHHVQYINRLCRVLCHALREDGLMVNFDYVGPHRNQYSRRQWNLVRRANRMLPSHIQKTPLKKPHLPSALYFDPTEAIHSDLIIESVSRYFDILERRDTGGGIAYELLTHNSKLSSIPATELNPWIDQLLEQDRKFTALGQVPPLFSYFIAKPRKTILADGLSLRHYQDIEDRREAWSRQHRGTYSYRHYSEMILHAIYVRLLRSRLGQRLKSIWK